VPPIHIRAPKRANLRSLRQMAWRTARKTARKEENQVALS
jgi:hypothetical protein